MDTLILKGLRYHALHGVYEREKIEGNDFEVDLQFELDLDQASKTDDLHHTVDYVKAEELVEKVMMGTSLNLIETLAHHIGELLFQEFQQVYKLSVTVRKIQPSMNAISDYSQVSKKWQR